MKGEFAKEVEGVLQRVDRGETLPFVFVFHCAAEFRRGLQIEPVEVEILLHLSLNQFVEQRSIDVHLHFVREGLLRFRRRFRGASLELDHLQLVRLRIEVDLVDNAAKVQFAAVQIAEDLRRRTSNFSFPSASIDRPAFPA